MIAGKAVGSQTDVEPERAQLREAKARVAEVCVTARTMHDVKLRPSCEQLEIFGREFIEMRDDLAFVEDAERVQ